MTNITFYRRAVPPYCITLLTLFLISLFFSSCNTNLVDPRKPTPTHHVSTPTETRASTATVTVLGTPPALNSFETGVATPYWSPDGYSTSGPTMKAMHTQTAARWVELPIRLMQDTPTSNTVIASPKDSASPASLYNGIILAHEEGLRVFVVPLLLVGGDAHPTNVDMWFVSYWQALLPFVQAAEAAQADQIAIGTNLDWLQGNGSADDWNKLIAEVYALFHGRITYDTDQITPPVPSWFHNAHLYTIGVSEYIALIDTFTYILPTSLPARWRAMITPRLDAFAQALGKPILLSSIGYRNSRDALYRPVDTTTLARIAPEEQDGAYSAALASIKGDHQILGVFAWGWSNVGRFDLAGMPAVKTIKSYYKTL